MRTLLQLVWTISCLRQWETKLRVEILYRLCHSERKTPSPGQSPHGNLNGSRTVHEYSHPWLLKKFQKPKNRMRTILQPVWTIWTNLSSMMINSVERWNPLNLSNRQALMDKPIKSGKNVNQLRKKSIHKPEGQNRNARQNSLQIWITLAKPLISAKCCPTTPENQTSDGILTENSPEALELLMNTYTAVCSNASDAKEPYMDIDDEILSWAVKSFKTFTSAEPEGETPPIWERYQAAATKF